MGTSLKSGVPPGRTGGSGTMKDKGFASAISESSDAAAVDGGATLPSLAATINLQPPARALEVIQVRGRSASRYREGTAPKSESLDARHAWT
jgi:hypothetical protein